MKTNQFINGLIVNDGWLAYMNGQAESDCPYHDDPTAAERWLHGHRTAVSYYGPPIELSDELTKSKWENKS